MPSAAVRRLGALNGQVADNVELSPKIRGDDKQTSAETMTALARERRNPTFSISDMADHLNGGAVKTKRRNQIIKDYENDPTFSMEGFYDKSRGEIRSLVMQRLPSMIKYLESESYDDFIDRLLILVLIDPGFSTRLYINLGLAIGTILGQGTAEQISYWREKGAMNIHRFYACFAMTELGHGSNVAGIETTATFDPASDEFVIQTPSVRATKWWIGGATESATHCVLFAQLIVGGKGYGVKPFVVQMRDVETFAPLQGVMIGDCGAKFGRNVIDNGWIQFERVRIPREAMLMRFTRVDRHGKVTQVGGEDNQQIAYGALIHGRTSIIRESCEYVKKAITIAVRYASVRRQGGGKGEEQFLMDYQLHKLKLIPIIATAYALTFVGEAVAKKYLELRKDLDGFEKASSPQERQRILATLKDMHGTTSGLKAFCTWIGLDAIETCRQSLGGQGYSMYAGLAPLYQDFSVHLTWEGDNSVMTLQAGRYLLGCLREVEGGRGSTLTGDTAYLGRAKELLRGGGKGIFNADSPQSILEFYEQVAVKAIIRAGKVYAKALASGNETEAMEACSAERFSAAKMHCLACIQRYFVEAVASAPDGLAEVLSKLACLFGVVHIQQNAAIAVGLDALSASDLRGIQESISNLVNQLRPHVVPLTDAFGLTDFIINSPLGAYDGNVYGRLFERVIKANPPGRPHPYFDEVIKPALLRK